MKKSFIVILIFLLAAAGGGAYYWQRQQAEKTIQIDRFLAAPTAATFYEDKTLLSMTAGEAQVKRADGKTETVVSETPLYPGDTIKILKGAGVIHWFDDSISRLKEGTELTLEKAAFNPERFTETSIRFEVVAGEVWSKVRALADKNSEFVSTSGNIVSGVRGSTYNLIVSKEGVTVESIAHAAFVGGLDPKTKAVTAIKTLVHGQGAKAVETQTPKGEAVSIAVAKIPAERLAQAWMTENSQEDQKAEDHLRQKNLNRLLDRAGPLPGQAGYDQKTKAIQERLAAIQDPAEKAKLEARVAQMKVAESMAVALQEPEVQKADEVATHLEALQKGIDDSDLPAEDKQEIMMQAHTELKAWDRALEEIRPDQPNLYRAKEVLREGEERMAPNPEMRREARQKILQRKYFEIDDTLSESVETPQIQEEIREIQEEIRQNPQLLPDDVDWVMEMEEAQNRNRESNPGRPDLSGLSPNEMGPDYWANALKRAKSMRGFARQYSNPPLDVFDQNWDTYEAELERLRNGGAQGRQPSIPQKKGDSPASNQGQAHPSDREDGPGENPPSMPSSHDWRQAAEEIRRTRLEMRQHPGGIHHQQEWDRDMEQYQREIERMADGNGASNAGQIPTPSPDSSPPKKDSANDHPAPNSNPPSPSRNSPARNTPRRFNPSKLDLPDLDEPQPWVKEDGAPVILPPVNNPSQPAVVPPTQPVAEPPQTTQPLPSADASPTPQPPAVEPSPPLPPQPDAEAELETLRELQLENRLHREDF